MFRRISAVATILALGLMLASCDKCGDWIWQRTGSQSCKGSLPQQ